MLTPRPLSAGVGRTHVRSTKWFLDTEHWPGPDRLRWSIVRDVVEPSPDGRFACVLYSCFEIRLGCEVGLLTLLTGSRFVAVTAYLYNSRRARIRSPRPLNMIVSLERESKW